GGSGRSRGRWGAWGRRHVCGCARLFARLRRGVVGAAAAPVSARRVVWHTPRQLATPPLNGRGLAAQSRPTTNPFKGRTGLDRVMRATGYSLAGLKTAYRGQSAFRQEAWISVILIPAA